jgi:UDP-N-acetylmuramoylalanine--D-glutamate ligase
LNLLGEHNRGNAAAALMIARQLGIDDRATADALETMEPLFGRLELTATYGGVRFYNDRMAAASPATARAIRSMPGPAILIIGGRDNGFDPAPIRAVAPALVKLAVVTPSDNAPVLLEALAGAPVVHVESLAQAVEVAAVAAQPGDCVLYSSPFAFYPAPTRGALVGRFRSIDVCRRFDAEVHAWAARHGLTVSAS